MAASTVLYFFLINKWESENVLVAYRWMYTLILIFGGLQCQIPKKYYLLSWVSYWHSINLCDWQKFSIPFPFGRDWEVQWNHQEREVHCNYMIKSVAPVLSFQNHSCYIKILVRVGRRIWGKVQQIPSPHTFFIAAWAMFISENSAKRQRIFSEVCSEGKMCPANPHSKQKLA